MRRAGAVLAAAIAMAAPPAASAGEGDAPAAAELPACGLVTAELDVSSEETIVTKAQRDAAGLHWWPDGVMGVLRSNPASSSQRSRAPGKAPVAPPGLARDRPEPVHTFFGANGASVSKVVGTLDDPLAFMVDPQIAIQGVPDSYDYGGGGPIHVDEASGAMLMFYHAERHPGGDWSRFYSSIGMARSLDGGDTWTDLGEIVTANLAPEAVPGAVEMQGAPFVVVGEHFYVYFADYLEERTHSAPNLGGPGELEFLDELLWVAARNDLAVARAPVAEVVEAAVNQGTTVPWQKYYLGEWGEPGRGGRSSPLEPGSLTTSWADVSYNEALDRYILVRVRHVVHEALLAFLNGTGGNVTEITYAESMDGLRWSVEQVIVSGRAEHFYPTIVGLGEDPSVTGEQFYVYYTSSEAGAWQRWSDAYLARRKVTVKPLLPCGP